MSNRHIQWSANTLRSLGKLKRGKISEVKLFRNIKFVGVKEFSLNLSRLRILDYIKNRSDIKVISLERKNPIDRMVSSFRLGKTGVVSTSSSVEHAKTDEDFWMDPSSVLSNLEEIDNENKILSHLVDEIEMDRLLKIDYDDFFSRPERTSEIFLSAQLFIGAQPIDVNVRMKKIINSDPIDIFSNSEEIRDVISGSNFRHFLR